MNYKNINKKELKESIKNKENMLLLDIRTKDEFDENNIDSSINIPLQNLLYNIDDIEEYKNKKIVIYCANGHRSITACNLLSIEGFESLYNLEKGINDYKL